MVLIAVMEEDDKESICGLGQYDINSDMFTAEVALVVRDDCQNKGVGAELLSYLVYLAKKRDFLVSRPRFWQEMILSSGSSKRWGLP